MSTYGSPLFLGLQEVEKESPWVSIAASYIMQTIALLALLVYAVIAPKVETPVLKYMTLVAPELTKPAPTVQAKPARPIAKIEPERIVTPVVPKIQPPPYRFSSRSACIPSWSPKLRSLNWPSLRRNSILKF